MILVDFRFVYIRFTSGLLAFYIKSADESDFIVSLIRFTSVLLSAGSANSVLVSISVSSVIP